MMQLDPLRARLTARQPESVLADADDLLDLGPKSDTAAAPPQLSAIMRKWLVRDFDDDELRCMIHPLVGIFYRLAFPFYELGLCSYGLLAHTL
jgi:hypothetical protein